MLEIDTTLAIKKFVRTFQVVRLRHLEHFFRDREPAEYRTAIRYLTVETKILHSLGEDFVSLVYKEALPSPLHTYFDTLRCLDMLTVTLKSSDVTWFDIADFPLNIRFMTVADELYDVAFMSSSNWVQKYTLLPIAWKKGLPVGQKDPCNHIAVVPDLDVAKKLRDLSFTQFIVTDHNGAVLGIYDNE